MDSLAKFKSIYASGIFIPDASIVTALSLLFEKIYLPNNIEFAVEFSRKFSFDVKPDFKFDFGDRLRSDFFPELPTEQRKTILWYLQCGVDFRTRYSLLFKDIFETDLFGGGPPFKVEVIAGDDITDLESLEVGEKVDLMLIPQPLQVSVNDSKQFTDKINMG